ncbi:ParB/RepB/Spo0J family partition protein [Deinococcus kurensis]|uniref:ParB/RepB/Spo0J family partition protein n=1 Tax=Deinococcus kurensis TaxID=2662757 RepID=UPI0012D30BC7|nr:ParB/RepB/Spo0J family partition protein [Deinococcus kurensis]
MKKVVAYQEAVVQLSEIAPNPWNPHSSTPEELDALSTSLIERGVIHPLVVVAFDRPVEWDGRTFEVQRPYMLVDGHQRLKAAQQAYAAGHDALYRVPVRVIGSLSEWEEWELAEIGQMANHQGGSLEDAAKTGKIVVQLQKRRSIEDIAKSFGQRPAFLAQAAVAARPVPAGLTGAPVHTSVRKTHNVVLPFDEADEVAEFESLVRQLAAQFEGRPTTKGMLRSATVLQVLRAAVPAEGS